MWGGAGSGMQRPQDPCFFVTLKLLKIRISGGLKNIRSRLLKQRFCLLYEHTRSRTITVRPPEIWITPRLVDEANHVGIFMEGVINLKIGLLRRHHVILKRSSHFLDRTAIF